MIVVGVIPAFVASLMAISLIVNRLKSSKHQETSKTLRIGTNLLMDHVEAIKKATQGLSKNRIIQDFFYDNKLNYQEKRLLQKELEGLGHGIIQIIDQKGILTGSLYMGEPPGKLSMKQVESYYEKSLIQSKPTLSKVLSDYANTIDIITITRKTKKEIHNKIYIRVASPVLDKHYDLMGAVVVTMALDELFCQNISTILGSHIILYTIPSDLDAKQFNKDLVTSFHSYKNIKKRKHLMDPEKLKDLIKGVHGIDTLEIKKGHNQFSVALSLLHNIKGKPKAIFAIATNIDSIEKGKEDASHTLKWVALMALAFVVVLAMLFSKTISSPLGQLLKSVQQIAKGKLDTEIKSQTTDEIADLAEGFNIMVKELRAMRQKQTEQISEIQTLHEISNAIGVQVGLDNVISQAMDSIGIALMADNILFFLKDEKDVFRIAHSDGSKWKDLKKIHDDDGPIYKRALKDQELIHIKDVEKDDIDRLGKLKGELITVPLKYQQSSMGVFYLNRNEPDYIWSEVHMRILRTLGDQLSVYIVNAQMFEKISKFNEALERMVQERTTELQGANYKLKDTLHQLKDSQVQVLISERLAGLGSLLAGVAHEINSPIGAIDAAVDNLKKNVKLFLDNLLLISDSDEDIKILTYLLTIMINYLDDYVPSFSSSTGNRAKIKELAGLLAEKGVSNNRNIARKFIEMKADSYLRDFITRYDSEKSVVYINFMYDLLTLNKSASSISMAIGSVKKIVVALRSYSHVKMDVPEWTNIHDVIETSLIILSNKLKHRIVIVKQYGEIPPVKVYGDELSQVWTNVIINAAQAIVGEGTITISTSVIDDMFLVAINDTGPGIPKEIQKNIFDPFFTTKKKGDGSGLGLGIVSRIVKKRHNGHIEVESQPGSTTFKIFLPLSVKVEEESKEA
jgi:signal transduction histidine kinase/HAMP domain-containing protein